MTLERTLVILYLMGCILIGALASRRVLASRDEYWVAGRRIGTWVNAMAIMAALASGGSIIGVMGLAYGRGIPYTLSLFAGAVVGFPLASILVAKPLRNFGKFTITDFLAFRFPHPIVRILVPLLIVVSFTVYIVAQMKAAGITAQTLLGIPYQQAVTLSAAVFVLYVSIGGMLAITWTDVIQGTLMLVVILGTAFAMMAQNGAPTTIIAEATARVPELGQVANVALGNYLGLFVIWAAAIPVIPHIVMRVFTAKDPQGARMSLNIAMVVYSIMILAAVMVIVPVGKIAFPNLQDADQIFLEVMKHQFPPLVRGLAVAAVIAAVMSTTDALLLACSSAISHDLMGDYLKKRVSEKVENRINVAIVWMVGAVAMIFAYSPPKLITEFYSAAVGMLSAGLFVPVVAGLWWKRANLAGGIASIVAGAGVYLFVQFSPDFPPLSAILYGLPASAIAMVLFSRLGPAVSEDVKSTIARLHR